jgi:hypothetical protein
MMADRDPVLAARLLAVARPGDDSDWDDVCERARVMPGSRPRPHRRIVVLVAAAVFLAVVTPAIAFRHQLVHWFSASAPASPAVRHDFATLDVGAPPGMAPHVISGQARIVLRRAIGHNDTAITWAAPTRQGGFCALTGIATPTTPHPQDSFGGCDRSRQLALAPGLFIHRITPNAGRAPTIHGVVLFSGDTLIPAAASIELTYRDNTHVSIPVTWISKPINAAFFVYPIPPNHWRPGHTPTTIEVKDASGHTLLVDHTFFNPNPFLTRVPPEPKRLPRKRPHARVARPPG